MNTSFAYNSTHRELRRVPGQPAERRQPRRSRRIRPTATRATGYQYDYPTAGSGIGNVYVNAKWLFKVSGLYQLPWRLNVSAFYNARQGYPFEQLIQAPVAQQRRRRTVDVLLDPVGESRLPNFQNLDFHVERPVKVGTVRFVPSLDVFNVSQHNTIQAIRSTQNAANANQIQAIVAPRVLRFGIRVNW